MTKADLLGELERLNPRERLELAYELLDSVFHDVEGPPLDEAQRSELLARLAHHRAHPDEPGVTLDEIRREFGCRLGGHVRTHRVQAGGKGRSERGCSAL